MDNEKIEKARKFCEKVRILASEYDLPFFVVTDGASVTCNNGCEAVRVARENHTKWEKEHGFDPEEDWGKDSHTSKTAESSESEKDAKVLVGKD